MADYDNVCSICSETLKDPAYFICDGCRQKAKQQKDNENQVVPIEQTENK